MVKKTIYSCLLDTLQALSEEQLSSFKNKLGEFPVKEGFRNIPEGRLQKSDARALCSRLLSYYKKDYAVELVVQVLEAINCQPLAKKLLSLSRKEEGLGGNTEDPAAPWEPVICNQCPSENLLEKIRPEIVSDSETYRLHVTGPGSFHCCYTDLIFELRAAVSLTYHFDSWRELLDELKSEQWMIAGPLFNIQADPKEAVAAVHFPHFLCLADEDSSQVQIALFVEEGMKLEKPDGVNPFHAVWKNPRFSPHGVIFKKPWFKRKTKVHAVALLYQELEVPSPKFHLYLLPNDSSLKKAVHDHEARIPSQRVQKPPATSKPLTLGSLFFMQKFDNATVYPKELEFMYLFADMEQPYFELYAEHMPDKLELILMERSTDERVWEAYVRQEELKTSVLHPVQGSRSCIRTSAPSTSATPGRSETGLPVQSQLHFIDFHREQLIQRTTNVDGVLDMLHGSILDDEQCQKVTSGRTNPEKMRELYKMVPSWNHTCKDQLYEALKAKHKFLIDALEGRRGHKEDGGAAANPAAFSL